MYCQTFNACAIKPALIHTPSVATVATVNVATLATVPPKFPFARAASWLFRVIIHAVRHYIHCAPILPCLQACARRWTRWCGSALPPICLQACAPRWTFSTVGVLPLLMPRTYRARGFKLDAFYQNSSMPSDLDSGLQPLHNPMNDYRCMFRYMSRLILISLRDY